MKTLLVTTLLLATVPASRAQNEVPYTGEMEKANYAYGLNIGTSYKQNNLEFSAEAFARGVADAMAGKLTLNPQEQRDAYMAYVSARRAVLAEQNKTAGEAFLAANKSKPGVQTTESGLQYKVLAEGGGGDSPKPEDTCVVKYRGTFIDGTEFDNSEKQPGGTTSFPANRVIAGWTEALTHMTPGAKWQLFIPSDLAYGEQGRQNIPPHSTLLFDVELVSFTAPPPPVQPAPPQPLTSDIIKVPSLEEMKKGAKIETIKAEEVERLQKEQQAQGK